MNIEELGYSEDTIQQELYDYNFNKPLHNKILKSTSYFSITLRSIGRTIKIHENVSRYISNFVFRNGKDSYAAIGKNLAFECRDGGFNFEHFKILCAINSIIGKKKKFVRITYDRIRFAMSGYRSKGIFEVEKPRIDLLTDKQLKNRIEFLNAKKFFPKFTYAKRQIYYSTKIDSNEELREAVKTSKIFWARKKLQLEDNAATMDIKKELLKVKAEAEFLNIEQRTMLHFVRETKKLKLLRVGKEAFN
jgi:hypothetical protein